MPFSASAITPRVGGHVAEGQPHVAVERAQADQPVRRRAAPDARRRRRSPVSRRSTPLTRAATIGPRRTSAASAPCRSATSRRPSAIAQRGDAGAGRHLETERGLQLHVGAGLHDGDAHPRRVFVDDQRETVEIGRRGRVRDDLECGRRRGRVPVDAHRPRSTRSISIARPTRQRPASRSRDPRPRQPAAVRRSPPRPTSGQDVAGGPAEHGASPAARSGACAGIIMSHSPRATCRAVGLSVRDARHPPAARLGRRRQPRRPPTARPAPAPRVAVGGEVTATFGSDDPGFFNYAYLRLQPAAQRARRAQRVGAGDPRSSSCWPRCAPTGCRTRRSRRSTCGSGRGPSREIDVQIGRVPPTFGLFGADRLRQRQPARQPAARLRLPDVAAPRCPARARPPTWCRCAAAAGCRSSRSATATPTAACRSSTPNTGTPACRAG